MQKMKTALEVNGLTWAIGHAPVIKQDLPVKPPALKT